MKSIKTSFHRYISQIQVVLILLVVLPALYLLLLRLGLNVPYIQLSNLHELILLSGELLILSGLYKKYFYPGWDASQLRVLVRDFLLANSVLTLPFVLFYTDRSLTVMPLFKLIRPYLIMGYLALIAVTIIAILSTQKNIRAMNTWLRGALDNQRELDEKKEAYRGERFRNKYPNFSSLIILGPGATKISKVGLGVILGFLVLVLFGLLLRIWNLDALPPYVDELNHLFAAKSISEGLEQLSQLDYDRSLYTVTLPVALFSKIFGFSVWNARFVGVLVNLLALIPLYLLGVRINKPIAMLSVGLFVFNPWMIAVSRNVREYAYYPFFFYLTALMMVKFYEAVPDNFHILKDFKSILTWSNLLILGVLSYIVYFAFVVDWHSTFQVILVLYPFWGLLLLRKIDWSSRSNLVICISLLTIVLIIVIFLLSSSNFTIVRKKINEYFLLLFYIQPPQQWYYNRPLISVVLLVLAIFATTYLEKQKFVQPFVLLVYVSSLFAFSFFKIKTNRPRYAITGEFWHILVMAIGLYLAFIVLDKIFKTKHKWLIGLVLLLLFWNIPQSFLPALYTQAGMHPITDEYHADVVKVFSFLQGRVQKKDAVVITGFLEKNFQLLGGLASDNFIYYDYNEPGSQSKIYDAISTYPSGWIVLDYPRGYVYSKPVPLEDFEYAGKQVVYLGWFIDSYVLRWGETE